jgi:hypothetical protein
VKRPTKCERSKRVCHNFGYFDFTSWCSEGRSIRTCLGRKKWIVGYCRCCQVWAIVTAIRQTQWIVRESNLFSSSSTTRFRYFPSYRIIRTYATFAVRGWDFNPSATCSFNSHFMALHCPTHMQPARPRAPLLSYRSQGKTLNLT